MERPSTKYRISIYKEAFRQFWFSMTPVKQDKYFVLSAAERIFWKQIYPKKQWLVIWNMKIINFLKANYPTKHWHIDIYSSYQLLEQVHPTKQWDVT